MTDKIDKKLKRKTKSSLVETIILAKKTKNKELALILAGPSRKQARVNLEKLNKLKTENIIIPGKVLGNGEIEKKLNIYALGFSESAKEKLKKAGCGFKTIKEALKNLKKGEKLKGEIFSD